ncbi:Negative regulator of genetic competence ClpC/MecB [compost metagenome]
MTDAAKNFLAKEGFDPQYGARPLRRAIQKHIEDRLSEDLLMGIITKGDSLVIDEKDGELIVNRTSGSGQQVDNAEPANK